MCCTQDSIFTYGKTLESCLLYKQQFPHFEGSFMGKWIRIFGFLFCHDKTSVTSIGQTNLKFSSLRRPAQLISKTSHVALLHLPLSKGQLSNEQKRTMAKHKKLLQLAIETWVLKLHDRRFTSGIFIDFYGQLKQFVSHPLAPFDFSTGSICTFQPV